MKAIRRDRIYCPAFRKHCTLEIVTESVKAPGQAAETVLMTRKCLSASSSPECEACKIIDA